MSTSQRETKQRQPEMNATRAGFWGTKHQPGSGPRCHRLLPTGSLGAGDCSGSHSLTDPGQMCYCSQMGLELSHRGIVHQLYQEETAGQTSTKCRKPQPPLDLPWGHPLPVQEALVSCLPVPQAPRPTPRHPHTEQMPPWLLPLACRISATSARGAGFIFPACRHQGASKWASIKNSEVHERRKDSVRRELSPYEILGREKPPHCTAHSEVECPGTFWKMASLQLPCLGT